MEDQSLSLLELLLISPLITGLFGAEATHVFFSSGENVRLSCNKTLTGCRSTTWLYSRSIQSGIVKLIDEGEKKTNGEGHERLSLGSDCSLNIRNITTHDTGLYICRKIVNGEQYGRDEHVYLHVLHASSQITPVSLTVFCRLYSFDGFYCRSDGLDLSWVNEAGVELKSDSRSELSFFSNCTMSLRTTLLNEEDSRDWRCQIKHRGQVKKTVTLQKQGSEETFCIDAEMNIV